GGVLAGAAQRLAVAVELLGAQREPGQLRHIFDGFPVDGHEGATLADPAGRVYDGRMKRAGGWFLGLLIVAAMAGGGWFALRRVLHREEVTILLLRSSTGRDPTDKAMEQGVRLALEEVGGKAGHFK